MRGRVVQWNGVLLSLTENRETTLFKFLHLFERFSYFNFCDIFHFLEKKILSERNTKLDDTIEIVDTKFIWTLHLLE